MKILHAFRIAAVLATDADFQIRLRRAPACDAVLDQLSHAFLIQGLERIHRINALLHVVRQKRTGIIPAEPQAHLGQVVGAEREELGNLGHFVRRNRRPRDLDHRPDQVLDGSSHFLKDFLRDSADALFKELQFLHMTDQRDHDFWINRLAALGDFNRGLDDRAGLHIVDFRIGDTQTAATVAKHGIKLVQLFHAPLHLLGTHAHLRSQFVLLYGFVRDKLMQRRVQQSDGHRQTVHDIENRREVFLLDRQQAIERPLAARFVRRQDHFAEDANAVAFKKHVLGAA